MGVKDKIRAFNGVSNYINRHSIDIGKPKRKSFRALDEHINNVFIKFGKEHNIPMTGNNSLRYKGQHSPVMDNAIIVQEHWKLFTKWIKEYSHGA
jgi:hypothetical protein